LASPGPAAPPTREQQIADIEKELATLNKRLKELRSTKDESVALTLTEGVLPPSWIKPLTWRSIGPATMGGRITALSVFEGDPSTYWVATASGGLLKTVNNGITFEHQFDREATVSIGDVCVAPSNKDSVWVGTGENNPRNSVSYGDGVYKSTDGGKTWANMGLRRSYQIGKILIHPTNPDTIYVGALGRLWGANEERGLFKTTDGGKTWHRILYVDDKTGIIDMRMHPADPETLLVAAWERQRDGHDSWPGGGWTEGYDGYDPNKKWGPGSGLYKTSDGGKTFRKITKGLPSCHLGRMGLDWYRKDPNTVFAIIDCEKIGTGTPPKDAAQIPYAGIEGENADDNKGAFVLEAAADGPAAKAGLKPGDLITRFGDKPIKSYADLTAAIDGSKPNDQVKIKLTRDNKEHELALIVEGRPALPGSGYAGFLGEDAGDNKGARLTQVMEDGPAAKAGLKTGDVVQKIGSHTVKNYFDLLEVARDARIGEKIKVGISRGNETKEIEVTFVQRPTRFGGGVGGFGPGGPSFTRPYRANYGGQRENVQNQQGPDSFQSGGVYKSTDAGETWTRINSVNPRPMYFSQVRVDPSDDKYLYVLGIGMYRSQDGGKTFRSDVRGIHADQHALWIDPRDGRHAIIGCDGGYYVTYDRMANWDHLNHMAIGQFYHVVVCVKRPYWVYGGLQDNGSWGGPSVGLSGTGPINEDWVSIGGGDGYVCGVDPNDPDQVYFESQDGGMGRYHLRTGERSIIRPVRPRGAPPYRFNWNTPFILSHHNSRIFYSGGNYVFRSLNRGDDLRIISPEITLTKRGSATALAESPRNPDVLWAGTDDGGLWVTRNGGKDWKQLTSQVGLPGSRWVATIEASRFVEGRAYVAFDGHRSNDDDPYVYVTEDFGETWRSLRANLPSGSTRCLREDVQNPNLLYLGTEFAVYASINRGGGWTRLNNNLPTVAVHEIAVHPTAGEIVAATHGRSLWILDVTALRQMSPEALVDKPMLFQPSPAVRWQTQPRHGGTNRRFVGQNPPPGAQIFYSLPQKANQVSLRVLDVDGSALAQLTGSTEAGLHKVAWDLSRGGGRRVGGDRDQFRAGGGSQPSGGERTGAARRRASTAAAGEQTPPAGAEQPRPATGGRPRQAAGGRNRPNQGPGRGLIPPGTYRVVLTVDGKEFMQTLRIEADPNAPTRIFAEEVDQPDDR
jgi:photosystem II stability/assembly factor-like uncharacterized protein